MSRRIVNCPHCGRILSEEVWKGTGSAIPATVRCPRARVRFKYAPNVTPDILFMFLAQRQGFVAKVHGDVLCGHLPVFPLLEGEVSA